jgi:hypothetical protein
MSNKSKRATAKAAHKNPSRKHPTKAKSASRAAKAPSGRTTNSPVRANSKIATVIAMLSRKEGTTIEQLVKATGWQAHSVRGALSGAIKKKLGMDVVSAKTDGTRSYRIANRAV